MNDASWYYMRDNHTFRQLTGDERDFKIALMEEFMDGFTYGMLCTKSEHYENLKVHANGRDKWDEFWEEVKEAIHTQYVEPEPSEPVEIDLTKLIIEGIQQLDRRLQTIEQYFKDDGK